MLTEDEEEDGDYELYSQDHEARRSFSGDNDSPKNVLRLSHKQFKARMNPKSPDSDDEEMKIFSRARDNFLDEGSVRQRFGTKRES